MLRMQRREPKCPADLSNVQCSRPATIVDQNCPTSSGHFAGVTGNRARSPGRLAGGGPLLRWQAHSLCDAGFHLRPVKWEPPVSLRGVGIEPDRMRVNRAGGTRPFRPSRSRAALLPVLRAGQRGSCLTGTGEASPALIVGRVRDQAFGTSSGEWVSSEVPELQAGAPRAWEMQARLRGKQPDQQLVP